MGYHSKKIWSSLTNRSDRQFRHGANASSRQSSRALDPHELLNAREERIRELKRQIDAGTYAIDPFKIAARMLAHIVDSRNAF